MRKDEALKIVPAEETECSRGEWNEGFAHFWAVCWRKVARYHCEAKWAKLYPGPDRAECETLFAAIMEGAERSAKSYSQREPQYRPHPSTWLNQHRWEDEDE